MAQQSVASPGFKSMKPLGVFLPPSGKDASPSQGYPQYYIRPYPFIHFGRERHCDSVKCLAQEHKTMSMTTNGSKPDRSLRRQAPHPEANACPQNLKLSDLPYKCVKHHQRRRVYVIYLAVDMYPIREHILYIAR